MLRVQRSAVVFAVVSFLLLTAHSSQAETFGIKGRDGSRGFQGQYGRDGQSAAFIATGQAMYLDLSGEDGGHGGYGEDGEDAANCYQGRPPRNLTGARGGDGGEGGDGGAGGNGGDLTIYTEHLSHLRMITVRSAPGNGGREGFAGKGGRPCTCTYNSWTALTCHPQKQPDGTYKEVCRPGTYHCTRGTYGYDGRFGVPGNRGSHGTLRLIPQTQPLPSDDPARFVSIADLVARPQELSKNTWNVKSGAAALFAPGSELASTYLEFSHRQEFKATFSWQARKPISEFSAMGVGLEASTSGKRIHYRFPESLWYQAGETWSGDRQNVVIEKALHARDAERLRVVLSGDGANLVADVFDDAAVSDLVATRFNLVLWKDKFFGEKKLYEGAMPADLVEAGESSFRLKLGMIPGIDAAKELKKGSTALLDLEVVRNLNSFEAKKRFEMKHKIPKD